MNRPVPDFSGQATALRAAFDRSFASSPRDDGDRASEPFLTVRAGGLPYAFRVRDIERVVSDRRIVPVPSSNPALLGLVGFRGALTPVFAVSALLGRGSAARPTCFARARSGGGVAFGVDAVDKIVFSRSDDLVTAAEGSSSHVRRLLCTAGAAIGVLDVPSLLAAIKESHPTRHGKTET